jgi:hypothetical protein
MTIDGLCEHSIEPSGAMKSHIISSLSERLLVDEAQGFELRTRLSDDRTPELEGLRLV